LIGELLIGQTTRETMNDGLLSVGEIVPIWGSIARPLRFQAQLLHKHEKPGLKGVKSGFAPIPEVRKTKAAKKNRPLDGVHQPPNLHLLPILHASTLLQTCL